MDSEELREMESLIKDGEQADDAAHSLRKEVQAELANPRRYRVTFAGAAPNLEQIQQIAMRGLMSRETEAALSMAAIGQQPHMAQLQQFPNRTRTCMVILILCSSVHLLLAQHTTRSWQWNSTHQNQKSRQKWARVQKSRVLFAHQVSLV